MSVKYADGAEYRGAWNNDGQRHGVGHMTFSDQSQYRGQFSSGLCEGCGAMTFGDGSSYLGEFHQGQFEGHGCFTTSDGITYTGQFKQGRVSGSGLMTFADGTHGQPRCEGVFESGQLVQRQKCQGAVDTARAMADRARQIQANVP